jgi:hypothetical protein
VNKCVELLLILLFFLLFMPLFILATNGNLRLDRIDTIIGACSYAIFPISAITSIFLLKLISKISTWLFISILLKSDVVVLTATKTYAIPLRMVGRSKIRLLIPELRDSYILNIKIRLDSRCKQVAAEYDYLKLEMQAYNILKG